MRRPRTLRAGVLAVLVAASLCGCEVTKRISEGAYRNAVTDGTIAELKERGVRLQGRPSCTTPKTGSASLVRVTCTARTDAGAPVTVTGVVTEADTAHPRERYVITVGGREVIRKDCLGLGCRA